MSVKDVKTILKDRRLELHLTQLDVAKAVGVSEATISRWESGNIANMKRDKIALLADVLRISPKVIMGWEEEPTNDIFSRPDIRPIVRKKFPLLGNIACGEPIKAIEEFDTFFEANADIRADFCVTAQGDSMINARIFDGDIVFIKQQPIVDNGQIAAVVVGDEVTLKRFHQSGNKVVLSPENPAHEPLIYTNEELEQIHILGKAVAFMSTVR